MYIYALFICCSMFLNMLNIKVFAGVLRPPPPPHPLSSRHAVPQSNRPSSYNYKSPINYRMFERTRPRCQSSTTLGNTVWCTCSLHQCVGLYAVPYVSKLSQIHIRESFYPYYILGYIYHGIFMTRFTLENQCRYW